MDPYKGRLRVLSQLKTSTVDKTDFKQIRTQTGFGTIATAGGQVTIGAKLRMKVHIVIDGISTSQIDDTVKNFAQQNHLNDVYENASTQKKIGGGVGFFWGFLGLAAGGSYEESYNKTVHTVDQNSNGYQKALCKKISELDQSKLIVQGQVQIQGLSMVPSTGKVYVEIMHMTRTNSDGKTVSSVIVGTNAKFADEDGNEAGKVNGKLNIIHF